MEAGDLAGIEDGRENTGGVLRRMKYRKTSVDEGEKETFFVFPSERYCSDLEVTYCAVSLVI